VRFLLNVLLVSVAGKTRLYPVGRLILEVGVAEIRMSSATSVLPVTKFGAKNVNVAGGIDGEANFIANNLVYSNRDVVADNYLFPGLAC